MQAQLFLALTNIVDQKTFQKYFTVRAKSIFSPKPENSLLDIYSERISSFNSMERKMQNCSEAQDSEKCDTKIQTVWREFNRSPSKRTLAVPNSDANNGARNFCCGYNYSTVALM